MAFSTIITEGGLLPADILDAIAAAELPGQKPEDFGLDRARNLSDRISAAWQAVRGQWALFQSRLANLPADDAATTLTRERWIVPFLEALDYTPERNRTAYLVDGRTYAISHRAGEADDTPPIHVEGIRASLDARPPSGRPRLSPHALMQEYLNSTEQLWGLVTNGERLRLLRDSARFTRPTYVEFDLRSMMEGENYSDFSLLYRLLHRSRMPASGADASTCLLEQYHQQAVESGGRVREKLRDGVESALKTLGNGLLSHPANSDLRAKLADGTLAPLGYYRQLLKLVYRLLFLMVAEERGLIATGTRRMTTTDDDPFEVSSVQSLDALLSRLVAGPTTGDRLQIYYDHYSLARLRRLAEHPGAGRGPFDDLWLGLQTTFRLLEGSDEQSPRSLGLAPLDGDLFGPEAIADLERQQLRNADLLGAIRALSLYREKESKTLRRVNYGALDVEELGSVYESLLDFRPVVQSGSGEWGMDKRVPTPNSPTPQLAYFDLVAGTERKTTGSYYTRPELVQELIKSALVPVMEDRLAAARTKNQEPRTRGAAAGSEFSVLGSQPLAAARTKNQEPGTRGAAAGSEFSVLGSQPLEEAILSIRVVDPACGSGHFLLAAARRLGRELARIRSGEDQPTPSEFRRAVRDVIRRCIFGVDLNPLAVDLCKLALWIEGHNAGMPLSFLDHHIKHGNSLIGATRVLVEAGIPDDAYKPVTGDDKKIASEIRKRNRQERELHEKGFQQPSLFDDAAEAHDAAGELRELDAMTAATVAEVRAQARRYRQIVDETAAERTRFNLWTAAFFQPLTPENAATVPTTRILADYQRNPRAVRGDIVGNANGLAAEANFFHWELEFPQVFVGGVGSGERGIGSGSYSPPTTAAHSGFVGGVGSGEWGIGSGSYSPLTTAARSGFDVVLGNPPWEMINLMEQEHFVDIPEIAQAANKAAREKKIAEWRAGDDQQRARIAEFDTAKYRADASSRFLGESGRFPLTAVGRLNTYALFAEHARNLINGTGRAGIIVPTGIATDDSTKAFFGDVTQHRHLVSLTGFENEAFIFADVHNAFKFCALTIAGENAYIEEPDYVFLCRYFEHIAQKERHFALSADDIALINPNTRTAPVFRTRDDAELTKKIYRRVPVLVNESLTSSAQRLPSPKLGEGSGVRANPWGVSFRQGLFNMSSDSGLFRDTPAPDRLPLYEAKMIWQFDHRFATLIGRENAGNRPSRKYEGWYGVQPDDPSEFAQSQYWVEREHVEARLADRGWQRGWLLGFRDIARSTDERTAIFSLLPRVAVGNKIPLIFPADTSALLAACFLATVDSLTFDFVTRQKVGGTSLNFFIVYQLPVLPPSAFSQDDIAFIVPRVLELVYTAWDIKAFAEDVWEELGNSEWGVGIQEAIHLRWSECNGQRTDQVVSGSANMATGHGSSRTVLSPDTQLPQSGTVWNDQPDTSGGSINSSEHRGGLRAGTTQRVHPLSADRAGIAQGTGNTSAPERTLPPDDSATHRPDPGNLRQPGQNAAQPDPAPAGVGNDAHSQFPTPNSPLPVPALTGVGNDAHSPLPNPHSLPPPFIWNDERRALIRAELDARIARLYGLTRDELRYILDPHDVYGPDFPGETFRVLKEKEIKQFGEYRTRRLVLEAWDRDK